MTEIEEQHIQSMKRLGDYVSERAWSDDAFMIWVDSFKISKEYYDSIINPLLFTEWILRQNSFEYEYEQNKDIANMVLDYIEDNDNVLDNMTDRVFDTIVMNSREKYFNGEN